MGGMRVAVVSDSIGPLSPRAAGSALAAAWAQRGAQCAVIGSGAAGSTWLAGLADTADAQVELLPTAVDAPLALGTRAGGTIGVALEADEAPVGIPAGSSLPLGRAIADALTAWPTPEALAVDLTWARATHDGGTGLLAALGATADVDLTGGLAALAGLTSIDLAPVRERLAGIDLVGVVPADELETHLLGLRGISAGRGHTAQLHLADSLAADRALERLSSLVGADVATAPGAGACGGAGLAILALGGRLASGPGHLGGMLGLGATIAAADLVVAGCNAFDFLTRGGDVVTDLARRCGAVGVPLVVVAGDVVIGNREMRTFGVEAAHGLDLVDATAEEVTASAARIATSWTW